MERKLLAGPRLRRLRKDQALTQAQMAEALGVSASYLNLIERNQRPVTAQFLVRLSEAFDVDIKAFAGGDDTRLFAELREAFADPVLADFRIESQELRDMAAASPAAADAVIALYSAYREAVERAAMVSERLEDGRPESAESKLPMERVRDFLHDRGNHFPELEAAAEKLWDQAGLRAREVFEGVRRAFAQELGVSVAIAPADVMGAELRRYDLHGRRLMLSEALDPPARAFHLAHHYALMTESEALDAPLAEAGLAEDAETRRLGRVALANYFAGCALAPYDRFLRTAKEGRYDITLLMRRFELSFEQVAHRLTTLQRPGAKGVPFFLMRVDSAGNVSKRFSAGGFHFARFGGGCPRWNVHDAFAARDRILTQLIETTDGAAYLTIARATPRTGAEESPRLAVVVGCPIDRAGEVAYADALDLDNPAARTPIGAGCRVCERYDCAERASPPLGRRIGGSEWVRGVSPIPLAGE